MPPFASTRPSGRGDFKVYQYHPGRNELQKITYFNALNPTPTVSFDWHFYFPRLLTITDGTGQTYFWWGPPGSMGAFRYMGEGHVDSEDPMPLQQRVSPFVFTDYDELGRKSYRSILWDTDPFPDSSPLEERESWQYDNIGRVTHHKSALGTFDYGYLGQSDRITSRTLAGTNLATTWTYDSAQNDRRLLSIANSNGAQNLNLGYQRFGGQTGVNVYGQVASILQTGGTAGPIQVILPSGHIVRVGRGFDEETFSRVIALLSGR
jgi:hypothetical protein